MKKAALIILDGFGLSDDKKRSAILKAKTPFIDELFKKNPSTSLFAAEENVGLPKGQMGNSEVGHLNIGAGRIVYQNIERINNAIKDKSFFKNPELKTAMNNAKKHSLHIMGLVSNGGVHSSMEHLYALLDFAKKENIKNVFIHAFLDGRDTPVKSGKGFLEELSKKMEIGKIASISGRYYSMDRDNRWERIKESYSMLTLGASEYGDFETANDAIKDAYKNGETDEFVLPRITKDFEEISDNDSVIFFNFRPDRARELTNALTQKSFKGFERHTKPKNLTFVCMTEYDKNFKNVLVAFKPEKIKNTLGEYLSKQKVSNVRIAETEKYAHVTFFFNGGIEKPYPFEDRILIPSPKVPTYDKKPEMSAFEVTERAIEEIKSGKYQLIILNYANPDMVGHTGNMAKTVKAIEAIDKCLEKLIEALSKHNYETLITADHGNAENMLDDKGKVVTAHSLSKVPLLYVGKSNYKFYDDGKLADIVPTLLNIMGIVKPKEMTGKNLIYS